MSAPGQVLQVLFTGYLDVFERFPVKTLSSPVNKNGSCLAPADLDT
jgi:hypothetical protein